MRNQIAAAERAGIRAATINSTNVEEWRATYAAVSRGEIDVLLLSPERLNNPEFRDNVLPQLAATCGPARRRRGALHQRLGTRLPARLPPAAHAAARAAGRHSGAGHHGDRQRPGRRPTWPRSLDQLDSAATADRARTPSLSCCAARSTANRCTWASSRCRRRLIGWPGWPSTSTRCPAPASSTRSPSPRPQQVAAYLRDRGLTVTAYSGQTEQAERLAAEDDLINNRVKALVATSALGMGFDKPDLGFVDPLRRPVVADLVLPAGRPRRSRGRSSAEVVLLPGAEDEAIWAYFASARLPARAPGRGPR